LVLARTSLDAIALRFPDHGRSPKGSAESNSERLVDGEGFEPS
jgi:hypothetical protein